MRRKLVSGWFLCAAVALLVGLLAASRGVARVARGGSGVPARNAAGSGSGTPTQPSQPLVPFPASASQLASEIDRAQQAIDDRAASNHQLADAGLLEQLVTGVLARRTPPARQAVLALLRPQAAAAMRTDLAASADLSRITPPKRRFPPWRIVQPPGPDALLGYFQEAQSRFGVGWQYLAAIEFIETRFGRVNGLSSAGAQGPMQFLPSTWARYGAGDIGDQRDAILAAARFLVANGAPGDMATALYRYNNSTDYVAAVQDYAARMRADPRAYDGYYNWQVLYARAGGEFLLPVGYPRARPQQVRYP